MAVRLVWSSHGLHADRSKHAHCFNCRRRHLRHLAGIKSQAAKTSAKEVWRPTLRRQSDGSAHLGQCFSHLDGVKTSFPALDGSGPPLRVLPIGGLGEIGMNCMLIGYYDRFLLLDAGLMFPDEFEHGMNKVLPDTSFLYAWRDYIEAVIITHAHEDHIGALPWVLPALNNSVPVFAGSFTMQLVQRRMREFNMLGDGSRFKTMRMKERFNAGPFEVEPVRVTHSIPDCCGLILRSEAGNIVHTGDWKLDEAPIDGQHFDREAFRRAGDEGVTLMMSDSTNSLAPGRSTSESDVKGALMKTVASKSSGRIVATQFASNLHRLFSIKAAADAANRKVAFLGASLYTYLDAAHNDGRCPFDPNELVPPEELDGYEPQRLLIVTTGSQGEERSALNLAAHGAARYLQLSEEDTLIYSAKQIPGNEKRVQRMMNNIASRGPEITVSRELHSSGHAYSGEQEEIIKLVRPQHFLPVHGEYAFMRQHELLARSVGVNHSTVINNGTMLGVSPLRNGNVIGKLGNLSELGKAKLQNMYNDGGKASGTAEDMALADRKRLSVEGLVVAVVEFNRHRPNRKRGAGKLQGGARVITRALWTNGGRLNEQLRSSVSRVLEQLPHDTEERQVDKQVGLALRAVVRKFSNRMPDVIVVSHEAYLRSAGPSQAESPAPESEAEEGVSDGVQSPVRKAKKKVKASKKVTGSSAKSGHEGPRTWKRGSRRNKSR